MGKAELASHSSTSRRWESALHFCQSCVRSAQQEIEETHSHPPGVIATTQQETSSKKNLEFRQCVRERAKWWSRAYRLSGF